MPNHCFNVLKLKTDDKELVDRMVQALVMSQTENVKGLLNTIRPEPEYPGPSEHDKDPVTGLGWYDWRNKFWGTKWEAYDAFISTASSDGCPLLCFNTAWCPPRAALDYLHRELGVEWELAYVIECSREACGYTRSGWSRDSDKDLRHVARLDCLKGDIPDVVIELFNHSYMKEYESEELQFNWNEE